MKNFFISILHVLFMHVRPVAANEGDMDFRAVALELLGLPGEADDAAIQSAVAAFREKSKTEPTPEEVDAANERYRESCTALGIAEDSTPEDFHAALVVLPGRVEGAEKDLEAANTRAAEATVDLAINEGRIVMGDRDTWLKKIKDDPAAAANEIATLESKPLPNQKLGDMNKRKAAANTAKERSAQIQAAVNERMHKDGISYDDAYAAVKADEKFASIFEAMDKPAHQED